jgi:hypothetical protein
VPGNPRARHAASPAELRDRPAAQRRGTPFLVYRNGDDRQAIVELSDRQPRLTIGRNPRNDIVLPWDGEVSRLHAELERRRQLAAGRRRAVAQRHLRQRGATAHAAAAASRRRDQDRRDAAGLRRGRLPDLDHRDRRPGRAACS